MKYFDAIIILSLHIMLEIVIERVKTSAFSYQNSLPIRYFRYNRFLCQC